MFRIYAHYNLPCKKRNWQQKWGVIKFLARDTGMKKVRMKMSRKIFALLLAAAVVASSIDLFPIGGTSVALAAEMTDPTPETAEEQVEET